MTTWTNLDEAFFWAALFGLALLFVAFGAVGQVALLDGRPAEGALCWLAALPWALVIDWLEGRRRQARRAARCDR